jgi:hypothetical protein
LATALPHSAWLAPMITTFLSGYAWSPAMQSGRVG